MKASCDHPEINDLLLLCLDGVLPAPEQEKTLLHARDCAVCSEELRQLQEIAGVVKDHAAATAGVCVAPEMLVACAEEQPLSPAAHACHSGASCVLRCVQRALCHAQGPWPSKPCRRLIPGLTGSSEKNFLRLAARWYPAAPQPASDLAADLAAAAVELKERLLEWAARADTAASRKRSW